MCWPDLGIKLEATLDMHESLLARRPDMCSRFCFTGIGVDWLLVVPQLCIYGAIATGKTKLASSLFLQNLFSVQ